MKSVNKIKVLIVILFCSITLIYCQDHSSKKEKSTTKETTFTKQALVNDFKVFRESLEEMHPGLYMYNSKEEMNTIFENASKSILENMTGHEFSKILMRVVSKIGDGHLRVLPPKEELKEANLFPFSVTYRDNTFYIKEDYSESPIKDFVGAKIHSINGHSMQDFMQEYSSLASSDGRNETYKHRSLSSTNNFSNAFSSVYGKQSIYELEYIPMGKEKSKTIALTLQTKARQESIVANRYSKTKDQESPLDFYISNDKKYAYLKIASFDIRDLKPTGIRIWIYLSDAFKQINDNNVNNLILDLRYNGGGEDVLGKLLFSYFTSKEFMYYKSLTINNNEFKSIKYTDNPDLKMPKDGIKLNNYGTYDIIDHSNVGLQKPEKPFFEGKTYVLINGKCFSSTSEFLSMLHFHTDAVFIGEESGGGYYGNNSGFTPSINLPNTKIITAIPMFAYRMAVERYTHKDRGLIPDYEIQPTIEDELNGNDVEFNLARELINKK
ncbi:MAG: hypothetical protein HWD85_07860 [Flavobacteriaceae bacterium]|nr:hypothetical protein [Flavobacteriaceae bacterium]